MEDELKPERVQPANPLADGVWVRMGGRREYLVPALNFRALRELQPELEKVSGGGMNSLEQMGVVVKIAHASLKRNYPDMTEADVEDLIDTGNVSAVFSALVSVSGLARSNSSGETAAAG